MNLVALLRAAHFGPTVLVTSITFLIANSQFSLVGAAQVAIAIFTGQLVVGWSNDVIDFQLDRAANRVKKPLVSGEITIDLLKKLIPIALLSATAISFIGPLGLSGTLVHLLGLLSATLYNLKLKSTIFSPLPYIISFGALPWAIFLAAGTTPPLWLYLALALFTTAFHFLNVVKDLQWDIEQGVLGLPQRIGKTRSLVSASLLALAGVLVLLFLR
jgi:4-hydroxybenzoate polyprenyltransferase